MEAKQPKPDRTRLQRQKALQARGRRLFAVLTDPAAIARLAELIELHGSERAAIEWALNFRPEAETARKLAYGSTEGPPKPPLISFRP